MAIGGEMNNFNPTKSKTIGNRLMRNQGWTSNGMWALMTSLEPKFIAELKNIPADLKDQPDIERVIKDAENNQEMEIKNTEILLDYYQNPLVLLSDKPGSEIKIWVNAYYLALFYKLKFITPKFYKSRTSILVKNGEQTIGALMPLSHIESEYLK